MTERTHLSDRFWASTPHVHLAQLEERPAEDGKVVGSIPAVDTMKPFRAWVAWHPDMVANPFSCLPTHCSEARAWSSLDTVVAHTVDAHKAAGYCVVEVEVREVGE